MGEGKPFIGSEALASGAMTRHELRTYYRALMPNVYLCKRVQPSLGGRAVAAWLWSRRQAVVAGLAALHGSRWVDDDAQVELIWRNARTPDGVVTRDELLFEEETQQINGLTVTTPERTAFDLGRRDRIAKAVERLDALARATDFKLSAVEELAAKHRHARGLRQLEAAMSLVDAGAESPRETWLRLLLIRAGYPASQTQIPVLSADGYRRYYLDMGWEDLMLAVEYDGDHHRVDRAQFAYDIERSEDIDQLGWMVVRVAARTRSADILRRVQRAWNARTHCSALTAGATRTLSP
jgi:hypothetical protein